MAENKKNIASVGGVGLDLTLNDSGLYAEVKQAADKVKAQFVREFANIGKETDNTFKKSFSGVTTSSKAAANHVKDQFSKSAKAAGSEVEKQLKASFNEVSSASNSMSESLVSGFKKVGAAVIAAFSVAKIKEFGQSAIEQAARMNAQQSALTQTFREYEGAAVKAMKEVANESGFLDTRLQSVGTQIFAFAKTSGMDSASALNMMKEALQATADSAAYYDRSLEDTAESLKSFLKGNYANDAALGVSATETTRNAAAMKLYGQSFKDLSEAQKQLTLLQMVKDANALSGAMGQAAREADGWENVIGNLKESWNQLLAAVGKPILQGAIVVIKNLTGWISNLASYAKAASQALGELFGWGSDETAVTAVNTAQTASSIAESVENENQLTQAVAKANAEVKRGIAGFDKLNLISKSAASDSGSSSVGNDNALSAPIDSLNNLDTGDTENKIDGITNKIKNFLKTLYDTSGLRNFADEFSKSFDRIDYDYIRENIQGIGKDIADIAIDTEPSFEKLNQAFGGLAGSIAGLGNTVTGKSLEFISGGIRRWLDEDKEYISETVKKITGNFSIGFGNLTPIFDDLSGRVQKFFDSMRPITEGVVGKSLLGLTHYFGDMAIKGSLAFAAMTDGVKKFYFFTVDEVIPGITDGYKNMHNMIADVLNGIWNSAYQTVRKVGEMLKGIGSAFGQEWGWELPEENSVMIPKYNMGSSFGTSHSFATGGIVKAPTLAVVGDNPGAGSGNPEVISPLNKLQSMINVSGGEESDKLDRIINLLDRVCDMVYLNRTEGNGNATFVAELDGNTLFSEVIRQNELYKTRHGGRSAFV